MKKLLFFLILLYSIQSFGFHLSRTEHEFKSRIQSDSIKEIQRNELVSKMQGKWKLIDVQDGFDKKKARKNIFKKNKRIEIIANRFKILGKEFKGKELLIEFNDHLVERDNVWNEIVIRKKQLWLLELNDTGEFINLKFNGYFTAKKRYFPDIGEKRYTLKFQRVK